MSEQKFALITGCGAGGIGSALAREFHDKGFDVIATLLPSESREHLSSFCNHIFDLDITVVKSVESLAKSVNELTKGRLDVLVNNAGICYTMTAVDTDVSCVEKMFAVNVFGPMRMVHFFHRQLIETKGLIINIGSIGGISPYVYGSSYNASKAALVHWGDTLRVEMLPFGVRVMNVISGEVGTNILKSDANAGRELPEDSIFAPLADSFRKHIQRTPVTITPNEYAKGVVSEALKKSPRVWFWFGPQTFLVWIFDTFLSRTTWDLLFWRMFDFDKLVRK